MKWSIINKSDTLHQYLPDHYCFNIDKEIKGYLKCKQNQLQMLQQHISTLVDQEKYDGRLHIKKHVEICKIRIQDECSNKGKSGGYRCLVMVDKKEHFIYILHLYRKSEKQNISKQEEEQLKKLIDFYTEET